MNNLSLLVMAAGMGSRYGGLKQLDSFGPNNETIIDYSVYDAIKSGFEKIVFIIREEFSEDFKSKISDKFKGRIDVEHVYQSLDQVPKSFSVPNSRTKPWGQVMLYYLQKMRYLDHLWQSMGMIFTVDNHFK